MKDVYFYSYHIYGANGTKMHYGHGTIQTEGGDITNLIEAEVSKSFDINNKTIHLVALNKI